MKPTNHSKGGTLLLFVVVALLVVMAQALSFYNRSLDSGKLARRLHSRDVSAHLAEAARSAIVAALRQDVSRPATSRLLALTAGARIASVLDGKEIPLPTGWDGSLKRSAKQCGATVTARAGFAEMVTLEGANLESGFDPGEKPHCWWARRVV